MVTPVVLLAIPLFDTVFVAIHRARKGIPFFRGSPDHFALRLRNAGHSVPAIARKSYGVAVLLGVIAVGLVYAESFAVPWLLGFFSTAVVAAALVFSRMPPPGERPLTESSTPGDTPS